MNAHKRIASLEETIMNAAYEANQGLYESMMESFSDRCLAPFRIAVTQFIATQNSIVGLSKYANEFIVPYTLATNYFAEAEKGRLPDSDMLELLQSYMDMMEFNWDLTAKNLMASIRVINDYSSREMQNALEAVINTIFLNEGEDIEGFVERQSKMLEQVTTVYPQAIADIAPEFGFHFEQGINPLAAETDRFLVYQVMPTDKSVKIRNDAKPILILPPYVLGANILAFLPGDNRSYTHCFANQGIPTYIRVLKPIDKTPALQQMTIEEDALDTKSFCEKIMERHGKPVTLNGYCQGGFVAICNYLSGELDGVVDALLTCVSPMDGTRSKGLSGFLSNLPQRFNHLDYGTKTLENGNKVADGKLMGWVYKLKSIESEAPLVAFYRDMMMLKPRNGKTKISKTAAALNYWLQNERMDLPLSITKMSFDSFNIPITDDGTLPITLFGRKLNFHRIAEKKIPWLICYGERDDLVEKETALAPLDYIDAEIAPFPKGHVAMATSWSDPRSEYALHTRFGENKQYRGPVRYQLDLDQALSEKTPTEATDQQ